MRVETALARLGWAHLFSGQTLEASTIMTYPSGAMLCTNGNPIESLFVVLSGRVKIYTLSDGRPGDVFAHPVRCVAQT